MLKRLYIILLLTSAFILSAQARRYTIVIDAGHGGHDTGAQGEYLKEKDINLNVALAFGKYVEENMQDVDVVYTRKTDVFVPLKERANIANKKRADIFISIHTNAVPKGRNVYGIETYTMGLRRSNEKFSAALRENEVITYEEDYQEKYNGYDPKSPESLIMFELIHDSNMEESVSLASSIQKNICSEAGRQSKGVKQDVFLVLRETSMPACLVELGFISTPEEEAFLATKDGLDRLARGIYKGLASYTKKGKTDLPPPTPTRQETQQPSPKQNAQPAPPDKRQQPSPKQNAQPTTKQNAQPATVPATTVADKPTSTATGTFDNSGIVYRVQILTSNVELGASDPQLKGHKNVFYYKENGLYKYTIGETKNRKEAFDIRKQLINDFPDAFVIIFNNGKRQK